MVWFGFDVLMLCTLVDGYALQGIVFCLLDVTKSLKADPSAKNVYFEWH